MGTLDFAMNGDLKAIVSGEFGETGAEAHYKTLEPVFCDLILDDSLKTAMPLTCVKPAAERGAFDNMVIEQLEKKFGDKATELSKMLDEAAPKKAERDAAAEAAEVRVKDVQAAKQAAVEELASAKASVKDASDAVTKAQVNLDAYEPERMKATEEKEAKSDFLNNFRQNIKGYFELLCDHEAKPASPPEEQLSSPGQEQQKAESVAALPGKSATLPGVMTSDTSLALGGA